MNGNITVDDALVVFSLPPDFTISQLKTRFNAVAMKVHPDRGGSAALFQTVTDCYSILHDEFHARTAVRNHFDLKREFDGESDICHQPNIAPPHSQDKDEFLAKFNSVFDQTRVANPVEDGGYGGWLGNVNDSEVVLNAKNRGRDYFNREFEKNVPVLNDEKSLIVRPDPGLISGTLGFSELGIRNVDDYEIAVGGGLTGYDCKKAHAAERLGSVFQSSNDAPLDAFNESQIERKREEDLRKGMSAEEIDASRREGERLARIDGARRTVQMSFDQKLMDAGRTASRLMLTQQ